LTLTRAEVEHDHVGQSCMDNDKWHMTFSRKLTDVEWGKIGRLIDLDPRCYDGAEKGYVAEACGDVVHGVAPDVTMSVRYK